MNKRNTFIHSLNKIKNVKVIDLKSKELQDYQILEKLELKIKKVI